MSDKSTQARERSITEAEARRTLLPFNVQHMDKYLPLAREVARKYPRGSAIENLDWNVMGYLPMAWDELEAAAKEVIEPF